MHSRRWWILGVLCVSLLVIVLDNSILNVALPTIVRELDASNSQLQWIVDAYTLVFAGLLLTAGSLSDRFGRRRALQVGFVIFGLGSALAALASNAGQLITTRAFMGIGAAFIMPATLSIITNVFSGSERGRAIAVWAATAGLGVALGPLTGGFLLEHFYWGSVFLVNVPIVVVGLAAGFSMIPDSKDPAPARLDPIGTLLSIAALSTLVYAVIEGPTKGWTSAETLATFGVGATLLVSFFVVEARSDHPMLDLSVFRNPRFSAASSTLSLTFFAMFGTLFLLTQYLQFVLGFDPLEAGVRLLPVAGTMFLVALTSARIAERVGTKAVVGTGLALAATSLLLITQLDSTSPYSTIWWRLVVLAVGLSLVMAPATESIMGSLPIAKAGVGSAVNDTTRQVGGAVGVAVIGSVFSSVYGSRVVAALSDHGLPSVVVDGAKRSVGAALRAAASLGAEGGRGVARTVRDAFSDGFNAAVLVGMGALTLGVVVAVTWLPAWSRRSAYDEHLEADDREKRSQAVQEPGVVGTPQPGS